MFRFKIWEKKNTIVVYKCDEYDVKWKKKHTTKLGIWCFHFILLAKSIVSAWNILTTER